MAERATTSMSVAGESTTVTEEVDGRTTEITTMQQGVVRGLSTAAGVLDHVRVLDLSRIAAGPFCSMILGDLGATVFKVESVGTGDETRMWPPNLNNDKKEMSCYFASLNRNKMSICVNFKSPEGLEIIYKLAKVSDVLLENFVPGKLDGLRLGYEHLKAVNPKLVYCSITGYGSKGPYKSQPGYDNIAASVGGLFHITGPRGGDPCKVGVAMTDLATGLYAHGAILAALIHREKTGMGQKLDVNLLSTQIACLINIGSNFLNVGKEAVRWGTQHESIVPYQAFRTSDGYITLGAASDKQFQSLCKLIGLTELLDDARFSTNSLRVTNRSALLSIIESVFSSNTTKDMLKTLEGATFPFGPVNNMEQEVRAIKLTLKKPKCDKQVTWTTETVDNEHLNRKKSKCCCIYEKPRNFGESSSEDEGECENCFGHVELKKKQNTPPTSPPSEVPSPIPDP